MLEEFNALTKGQYPVFNKYPKFIVDYQVLSFAAVVHRFAFVLISKLLGGSRFRNPILGYVLWLNG